MGNFQLWANRAAPSCGKNVALAAISMCGLRNILHLMLRKWILLRCGIDLPHMPSLGVSSLDSGRCGNTAASFLWTGSREAEIPQGSVLIPPPKTPARTRLRARRGLAPYPTEPSPKLRLFPTLQSGVRPYRGRG